jgi:hypothetical protein
MRLPLMSEEASTVTLIHPAPEATAKSRLKGEAKEGADGLLPTWRCRYNRVGSCRGWYHTDRQPGGLKGDRVVLVLTGHRAS